MSTDGEASIDQVREQVRAEFARTHDRHRDDVRALEIVAIELELSVADCAAALGREDLIRRIGTTWRIEFPAVGPPALRRGRAE